MDGLAKLREVMMECPNCHAKLMWGYPKPSLKSRYDKQRGLVILGKDTVWCGCDIYDKNYCPVCGALVWECKSEAEA